MAGGAFSGLLARTHRQLCAFISLGAGTLLGVSLCGIAPECWEDLRWWFLPVAASGYFLFAIITRYVFHICPACAASHFDEATTHRLAEFALAMMIALGIHCTVDGLALAAGLEESEPALKISILFAICVHNYPKDSRSALCCSAADTGAEKCCGSSRWWNPQPFSADCSAGSPCRTFRSTR